MKRDFTSNRVICTNDCLDVNKNIDNKFDLVRFVYRRAKQLESDQRTPLRHFLTKIRNSKLLTEDGHLCNTKDSFNLLGRASVLNAFDATNSIEASMQEIYYGLRSPEIDDLIIFVRSLHRKNRGLDIIPDEEDDSDSQIIHE